MRGFQWGKELPSSAFIPIVVGPTHLPCLHSGSWELLAPLPLGSALLSLSSENRLKIQSALHSAWLGRGRKAKEEIASIGSFPMFFPVVLNLSQCLVLSQHVVSPLQMPYNSQIPWKRMGLIKQRLNHWRHDQKMWGPRNVLFRHQRPRRFLFALQENLSYEEGGGVRGAVLCVSWIL